MNKNYRLLVIPLILMMIVSGLVLVNEGTDESEASVPSYARELNGEMRWSIGNNNSASLTFKASNNTSVTVLNVSTMTLDNVNHSISAVANGTMISGTYTQTTQMGFSWSWSADTYSQITITLGGGPSRTLSISNSGSLANGVMSVSDSVSTNISGLMNNSITRPDTNMSISTTDKSITDWDCMFYYYTVDFRGTITYGSITVPDGFGGTKAYLVPSGSQIWCDSYTSGVTTQTHLYVKTADLPNNPTVTHTVTATADSPTAQYRYAFMGWSAHLSDNTPVTISTTPIQVNGDIVITPTFTREVMQHTVSIVSNNISWGTVSTPSVTVPYGTSISVSGNTLTIGNNTITATPHAQDSSYSYYFDYWYNASGTVTGDREIKAYFGRELTDAIQLFVGQTWTYTPTTSIPSATFSISGTATSWLSLSGGTITGTAPNVDEITYYHLVITAQTTNPTQTETQSMDFAVVPYMTASVSPNILYLWAGGPIPSSLAETLTFSYDGYGTGSYVWTILDAHNTGVQITQDGTIYGTAGAITDSPVSITARLTGNVNGIIQTEDVTFSVVIVAKLIFTSDPLTDAVIS